MPNSTVVWKSNRHLREVPPFDTFRGQNQKSKIKKRYKYHSKKKYACKTPFYILWSIWKKWNKCQCVMRSTSYLIDNIISVRMAKWLLHRKEITYVKLEDVHGIKCVNVCAWSAQLWVSVHFSRNCQKISVQAMIAHNFIRKFSHVWQFWLNFGFSCLEKKINGRGHKYIYIYIFIT